MLQAEAACNTDRVELVSGRTDVSVKLQNCDATRLESRRVPQNF